jgi:CTP synthase (UTP-ammonia lyase)
LELQTGAAALETLMRRCEDTPMSLADACLVRLPTEEIVAATRVACFSGLWCVPGSPYRSMEGALLAIRHARESGVPFLGTCGGFQHALSVEMDGHPFFVATLFQPERASLAGRSAPLAVALVRACAT